jgi:enoyl-CoA hydratase/carnithine racemase
MMKSCRQIIADSAEFSRMKSRKEPMKSPNLRGPKQPECPHLALCMMRDLIGTSLSYLSLCQGTLFTAEEAQELGLIDLIVEPNELQAAAEEQCQRWTQFPGGGENKTTLRKANLTRWIQERGDDLDSFVNIVDSPVTQQRIAAYLQSLKK